MTTTQSSPRQGKPYRRAALTGMVIGLTILGGYVAYEAMATPATPVIATASAAEVVAYISNERGLARLSQIEQEQFLGHWKDHVLQPEAQKELKACFDGLPTEQRKKFTDAIFKHIKRAFLSDAKQFSKMISTQERSRFVLRKVDEYAAQALFAKEVAGAFKADAIRSGPTDFQQWVLEHTTAEERAISEPYVDALKQGRELARKQGRTPGQTSTPQ
jgi:hypothetical protein